MLNTSVITSVLFKMGDYLKAEEKGDLSNSEALKLLLKDYDLAVSGGSVFKFLSKFIVQPTIFISKDLEGTPYERDAINAQLNIFTSTYIQAIKILTDMYHLDVVSSVNLLKTDKGELGNAVVANTSKLIQHLDYSLEDDLGRNLKRFSGFNIKKVIRKYEDDLRAKKFKKEDDLKELNNITINEVCSTINGVFKKLGYKVEDDEIHEVIKDHVGDGITRQQLDSIIDAVYKEEAANPNPNINNGNNSGNSNGGKSGSSLNKHTDAILKAIGKAANANNDASSAHTKALSKRIDELKSVFRTNNKDERKSILHKYTTVDVAGADKVLMESSKVPTYNYFIRNFDVTVNMSGGGLDKSAKLVFPITVHAHILYVDPETINSHIESSNSNDDNSFFSQWNDFRIGAKSFWDILAANTLVDKYRKNKLRDTEDLLKELETHGKNAKLRLLTTGKAQGFEKYYNLFILSTNCMSQLTKKVGDLKNSANKDKFMEMLGSQTLIVMDYEYELAYLYLLHVDGESKCKLNMLSKTDKKTDNNDILNAILSNTVPRI